MAIYEPLGRHLKRNGASRIPMTFHEVESAIGRKLPASAYRHRPWWANEDRGHSHAKAWLEAGYETKHVDMTGRKLVFVRTAGGARITSGEVPATARKTGRHPMIGALKDTFTIEPGYDLTQPAMPEWADLIDEKYGPEKR